MSALLLQALGVVCPTCDQFNPPGAPKCSDCGTPLSGGAPASAPASVPVVPQGRRATPSAPLPAVQATPTVTKPMAPIAPLGGPAPSPGAEPRADSAYPPGMRPAKAARPQLTAAPAEPVALRSDEAGPVSTVVPSAPTPLAVPITQQPRPETTPRPGPAPIPATELLKPKAPAGPAVPGVKPGAAAPSRFGISVVAGQSPGQRFRLGGAGCMIGRSKGAILFTEDIFVSPHHGTFILRDGRLYLRDEGSLSGTFVSLSGGQEPINVGGAFSAGQRLFRFAGPLPPAPTQIPGRPATYGAPVPGSQTLYALEEVIVGGRSGRAVVSGGALLTIGKQNCDLSYPGDDTLAPRHCELSPLGSTATLRDLSGGLGTFVRIASGVERALNPGDRVRIGQQILQVEAVA